MSPRPRKVERSGFVWNSSTPDGRQEAEAGESLEVCAVANWGEVENQPPRR